MKLFKSTFLLGLITLAVVLYAYFYVFKKSADEEKSHSEQSLIIAKNKSDLIRVKLERDGKFVMELEKGPDEKWLMVKPQPGPVNSDAIDVWFALMFTDRNETTFEADPKKDKDFGFDNPENTLYLEFKDKSKKTLHVGGQAMGEKIYLKDVEENKIMIINPLWRSLLQKDPSEFKPPKEAKE